MKNNLKARLTASYLLHNPLGIKKPFCSNFKLILYLKTASVLVRSRKAEIVKIGSVERNSKFLMAAFIWTFYPFFAIKIDCKPKSLLTQYN